MTKATLDVQFLDANGIWSHEWVSYIGQEKPNDPAVTHDWKGYSARVTVPAGTSQVILGLQIYRPGTIRWDDVSARFVPIQTTATPAAGAIQKPEKGAPPTCLIAE